jgi:hypothetical protein
MAAGRPSKGRREAYPQLAELAAWLRCALDAAGYESINQFVQRHGFEKNLVYGAMNGEKLLTLESAKQLASALGHGPDEIERIWHQAKQAMDLGPRKRAFGRASLLSWADVPWPDLPIQHMLQAQAATAEMLPYQLLSIEPPPLSMIYVRQFVRGEGRESARSAGESDKLQDGANSIVLPALDAIRANDHLLITGGAGAGKSILTQELTRRLARIWLRDDSAAEPPVSQPVVPLRLPARALGDKGSFSSSIAAAVREVYGLGMVTSPESDYFAHLVHGARWLLVIDGIDEIVEAELRSKIIRAISWHAQSDGIYRFIVTSRALGGELQPLMQHGFTTYSIEPFGQADLRIFARRWFAAQDQITAAKEADSFVSEIMDGRLKDTVANPLLATIAAVAKTRDSARPLPGSRIDLYGWFCDYLINDERRRQATLKQVRLRTSERTYQKAEWICSNIESLTKMNS